jgi:ribose transport system permease protein
MFGLFAFFSILFTDTFFTWFNFRVLVSGNVVLAVMALAATLPMIAGKIDLSIGFALSLWSMTSITFQIRYDLTWASTIALVLLGGAALGLVNGLLVELAQVDAFIATLGTGTVVQAIYNWHSGGAQQIDRDNEIPQIFFDLAQKAVWQNRIPLVLFFVLALAVVLWVAVEYLPIGRYLYAIGANPRAAELNGINRRRLTVLSFMASGVLVAMAGVLFASRFQIGQPGSGDSMLLPALVGAFLGSTTIRPGRVNIWGTMVGVAVGVLGIAGIQQWGFDFWVTPLFNGLTLIAAITIASYTGRRRLDAKEVVATSSSETAAAAGESEAADESAAAGESADEVAPGGANPGERGAPR